MQISFIPLTRRLAMAAAVPVAATLAFASAAIACQPPDVTFACTDKTGAVLVLRVDDYQGGEYATKGSGTLAFEHDGKPAGTARWVFTPVFRPPQPDADWGTLGEFPIQSSTDVNGTWKVTVYDNDGVKLSEATTEVTGCVTPTPTPSTSPSARPSASPSPTPTGGQGGGQPGMPKTGHPVA